MAGRIPQYFIDDLLARVNILDVVDGRVDKLKRAGKNYSGLCPFHKEKSPSFSVSPDKQFYYCFGCGAGGNAIGFLMEYDRLDFPAAVEELARLVGLEVPRENSSPQQAQRDKHLKDLYGILDEAARFYEEQLLRHPQRQLAIDYLKGRGLTGQVAKAFGIGFAPPGWENLMQALGTDSRRLEGLEQAGMLIHNEERHSHYDRFRERIMFPIRDMRGRVIAFGGRVLGDEKPKYLNSPETETFHKSRELYGLYEARQANAQLQRLIIVEGYMDVVGLAQYGIRYAVATLGTATTAQHLERLFKLVPEVVFCFDGDAAGRKAASRALETTLPVIRDGQEARFLFLPEGEDPDSLVRREGSDAFSARLDEALPLSEFFFRSLTEQADLESMDGRARFSTEALPLIRDMQPGLLQQMMLERICEITGLSLEQINSVINLHQATAPASPTATTTAPTPPPPPERDAMPGTWSPAPITDAGAPTPRQQRRGSRSNLNLCDKAISCLLHFPQLADRLPAASDLKGLKEPNSDVLIALIDYLQQTPGASLGTLVVDWQDEPQHAAWLMLLNEIAHNSPLHQDPEQELKDNINRLIQVHRPEGELDALLRKNRQSPLTRDEKQRLNELLARRQH
ncbi:DNA primase [Marinobacterium nitratireducens]|uniref:DNA primase n=1 Tax=Marinobacterium nitratireducens TaxID=518897 RepID=A0A917ZMK9_9GAMM|nr:DNA primase [Marinobacterium nitratireducens]GGO85223.1 DNA primase [Marinobacterium nitratireducens]